MALNSYHLLILTLRYPQQIAKIVIYIIQYTIEYHTLMDGVNI